MSRYSSSTHSSNENPPTELMRMPLQLPQGTPLPLPSSNENPPTELMRISLSGNTDEGFRLRYLGSQQEVVIRSRREHELSTYMKPKREKDVSKFVLCPMPGKLLMIYICNFHVLSHLLLIYICKLHWNLNTMFVCQVNFF